jgi:hypothetical protein
MKANEVALKYGFRSGLEEKISDQLRSTGVKFTYESSKLSYIQPAKKRSYTPDFFLSGSGKNMIIEAKGRFMLDDRKKHILIKEQYPELDIRFIFTNPNAKISKGAKSSYADWCNKNGFKYSKQEIPQEWLEELK